ncbi:glycosyltransferase involved in cell wall biosynthesis [Methanococcus maripaludis]|uniref:Glycosyltransferase involved in cell wall biosynthesis n=1 Tax=Methanococcus maripaludis TaxID=39152 RepID=A0A7J9S3R7_METMI|nr:glycosyltransferase family 4 protein [Methanococcus maripaludis]MBB6400910.1 glycosyltransferase involved in cell wall biosynthesis [Methanococcus maripaludis]
MKVLYLADGSSTHTYKYLKYFSEKGYYDITLFSMRPVLKEIENLNIKIIQNKNVPDKFLLWLFYYIFAHVKYYFILKKIDCDITHVHDVYQYGLFGLLSGKPYVITPWGSDVLIQPKKNPVYRAILPMIFSKAEYIIYEGENMLEELKKYCKDMHKIKMIRFGIDTKMFSKNKKSNFLKVQNDNKVLIISTRNLKPIYDIQTLIYAAKIMLSKNKKVQFLIIGEGSQKNELINLTKNLGISDNISFLGSIPYKQMPTYLSSSDIYVSTSLSDSGLACSTAEAMSCGLPVVITDFGDNSEWVKPDINGYLFEPKNPEKLANSLLMLIDDNDKKIRMGQKNNEDINKKYNYYLEMEKVEKIYKEIIWCNNG